ncbi:hypothetical protein NE237_019006 [Protea cynaroides]|uniref:Cystathionine gamma-lyase n=1 Tax=Protea cynaroides TaxID=273540 RepID=A0A9Q0KAZ1_9MAGN|nr:hypothetical protein NE237_019006 [Protea cynaroides]
MDLATARHEFGEHGCINMSIEASATFTVTKPVIMPKFCTDELVPEQGSFIYSRHFNPTVLNLNCCIPASRMATISTVLMQLCSSRGHVVASGCLYGGTQALLNHFLPRFCNITTTFVDLRAHEMVKDAIVEGRTTVFYLDSMSNPTLIIANLPELCRIAHDKGVKVVVDNTFTPMILSPARLGADIIVHSLTKYISGGADVIAGTMKKLRLKVIYLGLEEHPDQSLLKSMANENYGFGGILCLDMETEEKANQLMNHLLGYHATLMSCSGSSTSSEMNAEEKEMADISPGLIRMSIGYSGTLEQKWTQFEKALAQI